MVLTEETKRSQLVLWRQELKRLESLDKQDLNGLGASMVEYQIITARQNIEYLESGTVGGVAYSHKVNTHRRVISDTERRRNALWKLRNAREQAEYHERKAATYGIEAVSYDPGELSIPGRAGATIDRDLDILRERNKHLERARFCRKQEGKALDILRTLGYKGEF